MMLYCRRYLLCWCVSSMMDSFSVVEGKYIYSSTIQVQFEVFVLYTYDKHLLNVFVNDKHGISGPKHF